MKKIDFKPTKDIQSFLYDNENLRLYNAINVDFFSSLISPLEYFNLLFEQIEISYANYRKPLDLIKHLKQIHKNKYVVHAVLNGMFYRLNKIAYVDETNPIEELVFFIDKFLHPEYILLHNELYPEKEKENPEPNNEDPYNFYNVKQQLKDIHNIEDKIKHLIEVKTTYLQNKTGFEWDTGTPFDEQCKLEIKKLKKIQKLEEASKPVLKGEYLKVKTLFQFIEYLHSNTEYFNQYNGLIKEMEVLKDVKNQLKPEQNYKDKLQYNKLKAELESKFKTLQDNTANLIKAKAKELNVCNFDNEPNYNFNGVETEIRQLKDNFSNEDLPEIFKHKRQYLEYRSKTHGTFLSLQFFFNELDEITKSLFDYFKDTEQNEFEPFETKPIEVNTITEAAQRFNKQGQTKFIIPNFMDKTQSRIREQLADINFFQIEVVADLKFEGKIYKDVKQRNNDSILTPENWEQNKETFYSQRMATYKDSYTLSEKLKLELSVLEKLPVNKTDYQILKDRYKAYLRQKQALPPEPIDIDQSRTKQVIAETFENMDKKGWQYAFSTEQDYNLFADLLTNFFEYKSYTLPETTIQLKRTCKTKVAKALGEIHKELSNENKLSTDTKYFQLIRVLSHFEKEMEGDLYKALTR